MFSKLGLENEADQQKLELKLTAKDWAELKAGNEIFVKINQDYYMIYVNTQDLLKDLSENDLVIKFIPQSI